MPKGQESLMVKITKLRTDLTETSAPPEGGRLLSLLESSGTMKVDFGDADGEDDKDDADYDPNKGLVEDEEEEGDEDKGVDVDDDDDAEEAVAKRKEWLKKDPTTRIVIFSRFLKFLDLINEALKRRANVVPLRLDGGCTKEDRQATTTEFSAKPGSILLITPKTGGAGLNGLECASKLIQCEPRWTAAEEAQVYGRLARPRQDKIVEVYYLFPSNSTIGCQIQKTKNGKVATNEKIMGPLRRLDEEAPEIPEILEHY